MKISAWQKWRLWMRQKSFKLASWIFPRWTAGRVYRFFSTPQKVPTPESEKAWVASGRRQVLQNGICIYEWGREQAPPVLLIHGWSGRGTQLGAFMPPLVALGFRVIAMDGPAHGESTGTQTNVGDFAQALIQVQHQVGPLEAAIGHSFGAGCLVLAAARGLKVRKLVLVAGPADYARVVQNFVNRMEISPRCAAIFTQKVSSAAGLEGQGLKVGEIGASLGIPVLIVHDEDDQDVRFQSALQIHEAWPGSEMLVTQGLGHRRIMKDEKVVRKVAIFIS